MATIQTTPDGPRLKRLVRSVPQVVSGTTFDLTDHIDGSCYLALSSHQGRWRWTPEKALDRLSEREAADAAVPVAVIGRREHIADVSTWLRVGALPLPRGLEDWRVVDELRRFANAWEKARGARRRTFSEQLSVSDTDGRDALRAIGVMLEGLGSLTALNGLNDRDELRFD